MFLEKSHLKWFRHLGCPLGAFLLPLEVFQAHPTGRRRRGRLRTRWSDYIVNLTWERLEIPQEELECDAEENDIWSTLLNPKTADPDKWKKINGWNKDDVSILVLLSKLNSVEIM